jgi:hypothetical protein
MLSSQILMTSFYNKNIHLNVFIDFKNYFVFEKFHIIPNIEKSTANKKYIFVLYIFQYSIFI